MKKITIGSLKQIAVHYVGNKNNGDGVKFSESESEFEEIKDIYTQLLSNSFNFEDLYEFHFLPKIDLNPTYQFVKSIFDNQNDLIEQSQNCARHLYDKSDHPKIKEGELQIAYLSDCEINGKRVDAISIIKSENKETFLKIIKSKTNYELAIENGVNATKLDKGCVIFNTKKGTGYIIAVVDNSSRGNDARYWVDDFLSVRPIRNEFHQTNEFLGMAKNFVTKQLPEEFEVTKTDRIDLLNKSMEYFKTHESFDKKEFEKEVFQDTGIIKSFRNFDSAYQEENSLDINDNFDISTKAVKKQARVFKSVLKLDRNFHIYIHGNRDLIEQGIEKDGRKYYKIYYEDEN